MISLFLPSIVDEVGTAGRLLKYGSKGSHMSMAHLILRLNKPSGFTIFKIGLNLTLYKNPQSFNDAILLTLYIFNRESLAY